MRRFPLVLMICASCSYQDGQVPAASGEHVTLNLRAESDGDLGYCDDNGACVSNLPNPDQCALLEVSVDTATGATCERCLDAAGNVIYERCGSTSVACVLITIAEPDCVVCAYINGAVIFSSCVAEDPNYCEYYSADPNSAGGWASTPAPVPGDCQRCYDANGTLITDECGTDCSGVMCPAVACGDGYQPVTYPGECCPHCEPIADCSGVVCAADVNVVPQCQAGSHLVRDPYNCCGYYCEPDDCANVACPATNYTCPPGYKLDTSYPNCCGSCVYDDQSTPCRSDADCCPDPNNCTQVCSTSTNGSCMPPPGCDPSSPCAGGTDCWGVCRPMNYTCPTYAYPADACAGYWESGGRDRYGCPLPPQCYCYDGTVSRDGTCPDQCAVMMCPQADCSTMLCDTGYHCESGYPYCCGACVADGSCLYTGTNKSSGAACMAVSCAAGTHEVLDADCCPSCEPDTRTHCTSTSDCANTAGQGLCSTDCGDCLMDPNCSANMSCTPVCYGVCVNNCTDPR